MSGLILGIAETNREAKATASKLRMLRIRQGTLRFKICCQYLVLALTIFVVLALALRGKLDTTIATLLATLIGYMLRSTQRTS